MECPLCQAENRSARRYCRACGAAMEPLPCAHCAFVNLTGEGFCGGCGEPVQAALQAPVRRTGRAERRQLTVMFCDMVGSTALSGTLDAEELREVITAFQEACKREIVRFDGFVARYMGDGMLVYFGYPAAHEDDAERAVRAGLGLVDAVAALEGAAAVRVGIASGEVVVGDLIGEGASEEAAVIGETPNLAARLQGIAEPGTVILADRTLQLTRGATEVVDAGQHALKGFEAPVQAWRAVRALDRRAPVVRGQAPFAGREFEVALLADRWRTVRAGHGQVVLLAGAAGAGKSRLAASLEPVGPAETQWVVQCTRHHTQSPLFPWLGEIRDSAGLAHGEPAADRAEKLERWTRTWSDDPRTLAALASLLAIGGPWAPLEGTPSEQKDAMLAALQRRLHARLLAGPVRVLVEDVQWADATTIDLLSRWIHQAETSPLMLVLTHRPDATLPWSAGGHVTSLSLSGLPRPTARQLVRSIAGAASLPEDAVDRIVDRADGVPAYLEDLTRAVLMAVAESGDATSVPVPATLHDSLMAQLDRLGPEREVAQSAAVLGREFEVVLLARLLGGDAVALESALAKLEHGGLIRSSGPGRYSFKHALVRDVAYGALLNKAKVRLHCLVADLLLKEFDDIARAEPENVARHLDDANRPREAAEWWSSAATRAAAQAAVSEAITSLERALGALARTGGDDDREVQEQVVRLRTRLAQQLRLQAQWERAEVEVRQAIELATTHGFIEARSSAYFALGNLLFGQDDYEACARAHQRAMADAEACGSETAAVQAYGGLGDAYIGLGRVDDARDALRRCVEGADRVGAIDVAAAHAPLRAWPPMWDVDLSEARRMATDAVERSAGQALRVQGTANHTGALVALSAGDADGADRHRTEVGKVLHSMGHWGPPLHLSTLLGCCLLRGDHDAGRVAVDEALATWMTGPARQRFAPCVVGFVDAATYAELLPLALESLASGPSHLALQYQANAVWGAARHGDVDGVRAIGPAAARNPHTDCRLRALWFDAGGVVADRLSGVDCADAEADVRARAEAGGFALMIRVLDDVASWSHGASNVRAAASRG